MHFQTLTSFVIAALTIGAVASPTPEVSTKMTVAEMKNWVATTDSELTFVGDINELGVNPFVTTVTFCSTRTNQLCSGPCTVFTGSSQCIHAPNTNCLSATNDVAFCDDSNCRGSCNEFASCGTKLSNNFCFTPGTNSISLGSQ